MMTLTSVFATLLLVLVAAALEVISDAAFFHGFGRNGAWIWLVFGTVLSVAPLIACGVAANVNHSIEFGPLMGLYIAVWFIVSQVLAVILFGERPAPSCLLGGMLIVAGGVIIQLGMPIGVSRPGARAQEAPARPVAYAPVVPPSRDVVAHHRAPDSSFAADPEIALDPTVVLGSISRLSADDLKGLPRKRARPSST